MTKLLLVSHGHVEGISPERFRGRATLPLTAEGRCPSEAAREWFAENRYQDYLYLHGLSVLDSEIPCCANINCLFRGVGNSFLNGCKDCRISGQ